MNSISQTCRVRLNPGLVLTLAKKAARPFFKANLSALAFASLAGCYTIPPAEYENFAALAPDKRIMNSVLITWEVRPDAAEFCAKILKTTGAAMSAPAVACATWSKQTNRCTIITTPNPNHVVIGHEVRHCFEGHFH